jgi:hypothetical protein
MWERKSVSATVLHGHSPVKFGLKKSVVLLKLLISFLFSETERTEFAHHFRDKVNLEKIPTAFPFSKEEAFGKDGGLPRLCVPLTPHSCRKLMSPFLHVQTGKVSDDRAYRVRGDRGSRSCVRRQQWDTGDTQKRTDLGDAERDGDRMSQGTAVRSKTRHPLHPSTSRRESTTG